MDILATYNSPYKEYIDPSMKCTDKIILLVFWYIQNEKVLTLAWTAIWKTAFAYTLPQMIVRGCWCWIWCSDDSNRWIWCWRRGKLFPQPGSSVAEPNLDISTVIMKLIGISDVQKRDLALTWQGTELSGRPIILILNSNFY